VLRKGANSLASKEKLARLVVKTTLKKEQKEEGESKKRSMNG